VGIPTCAAKFPSTVGFDLHLSEEDLPGAQTFPVGEAASGGQNSRSFLNSWPKREEIITRVSHSGCSCEHQEPVTG
jgi:hypothetical protein